MRSAGPDLSAELNARGKLKDGLIWPASAKAGFQ